VLCLLEEERSGLCISFVGGSQAALALSAIAPRLTPPDYPHTILMALRSMLVFHSSGVLTAAADRHTCNSFP